MPDESMPLPFPHPDSDLLMVIFENAIADYETGDVDVRGTILSAAVRD